RPPVRSPRASRAAPGAPRARADGRRRRGPGSPDGRLQPDPRPAPWRAVLRQPPAGVGGGAREQREAAMPARPSAVELTDGEAVPVVAHEEPGEPVVVAEAHLHPMGMAVLVGVAERLV